MNDEDDLKRKIIEVINGNDSSKVKSAFERSNEFSIEQSVKMYINFINEIVNDKEGKKE